MSAAEQLKEYFATIQDEDEFIQEAHNKIGDFYEDLRETRIFYLWERSFRAFYGARLTGDRIKGQLFDAAEVTPGGKNGEIVYYKENHYANIARHAVQLITSNKLAFGTRAANTDSKSMQQTILADGLLDYYLREKRVQKKMGKQVLLALFMCEGWAHKQWRPDLGEKYDIDPATNQPIYEGDPHITIHSGLDVPRDVTLTEEDDHDWLFVRNFRNRYDLYSEHKDRDEEKAEKILSAHDREYSYEELDSFELQIRGQRKDSDRVPVWTFYHRRTSSLPKGRMVQFVGDVILHDGPLPYKDIPLYPLFPDRIVGTPYGYSPMIDLLGPQQAHDILSATLMTNNATTGVQNLWTQKNDAITVNTLSGGMKNLQSSTKPEPLQLTKSAPESYTLRNEIKNAMETLGGVSATVRGNPEANLKSGASLALVVSQSIQYASLVEGEYNENFERLGMGIIDDIRRFSKTERVASIVGVSNRAMLESYTADQLEHVSRVVVEQTNPLSKNISGRLEIARDLLQQKLITTPRQYITVLTTGQLDASIEGSRNAMLNLRDENETMLNGQPVKAVLVDNHMDHIREHSCLLDSPARKDPQFVQMVLAHIFDHIALWKQCPPEVLFVTGQQPPPSGPMPGPGGPGGPGGPKPPGPGGPQGGSKPQPAQIAALNKVPTPTDGQQPNMPSMPTNPLTGNQFDPETGGM